MYVNTNVYGRAERRGGRQKGKAGRGRLKNK